MQYHSCTSRWTSARGSGARPSLESAPAFCNGRTRPPHGEDGPNQSTMSIWGGAVPSIRAAPSDFGVPAHNNLRVGSLDRVERSPTPRSHPIRCETAELRGQVDSPRSLDLLQLLQIHGSSFLSERRPCPSPLRYWSQSSAKPSRRRRENLWRRSGSTDARKDLVLLQEQAPLGKSVRCVLGRGHETGSPPPSWSATHSLEFRQMEVTLQRARRLQ